MTVFGYFQYKYATLQTLHHISEWVANIWRPEWNRLKLFQLRRVFLAFNFSSSVFIQEKNRTIILVIKRQNIVARLLRDISS